jgi:hypothetical protein
MEKRGIETSRGMTCHSAGLTSEYIHSWKFSNSSTSLLALSSSRSFGAQECRSILD